MGNFLNYEDLAPLAPELTQEQADIYIEDIEAQAAAEAPCILSDDFVHIAAVKGLLRQAVLRWNRAGEGGLSSQQDQAGPFGQTVSFDNRSGGEGRLFPAEVRRLRDLCRGRSSSGRRAFSITPR